MAARRRRRLSSAPRRNLCGRGTIFFIAEFAPYDETASQENTGEDQTLQPENVTPDPQEIAADVNRHERNPCACQRGAHECQPPGMTAPCVPVAHTRIVDDFERWPGLALGIIDSAAELRSARDYLTREISRLRQIVA